MDNNDYWEIPDTIDEDSFDFGWLPGNTEPPYIHQFGTYLDKGLGPRLIVIGATDVKYHELPLAEYKKHTGEWSVPDDIDTSNFDFDWRPYIIELPYIHQFGTSDIPNIGPRFVVTDAVEVKYHVDNSLKYLPLDIVYLSNGETGEQSRYDRLCQIAGRTVKWVRGIDGRENALRHCAEISTTEWFILFPAKLWVDEYFDFYFQPRRDYEPKHYIFYAENPLNGLVYGHQAAVCYNRQLVLETIDYGLDFTMSKLHDIIPVISGIAQYNEDPLMTWRTAFREVIKLLNDNTEENRKRLSQWRTFTPGMNSEWSICGAEDGIEYWNSVNGDHSELMKTFSWTWLSKYWEAKYSGINPKPLIGTLNKSTN